MKKMKKAKSINNCLNKIKILTSINTHCILLKMISKILRPVMN